MKNGGLLVIICDELQLLLVFIQRTDDGSFEFVMNFLKGSTIHDGSKVYREAN